MERTRPAVLAALGVILTVGGAAFAGASGPRAAITAAVAWPTSTLLVSEIQTGGSSASDEFAEITNVGAGSVDLAGLEIVYVTSAGSTITRKASWTSSLLLDPGKHLFIANSSGIYAGLADATYSGGFAATGGAIVLRAIGGAPVDSVAWGDATNAFVEGLAATAPAAGSSIERRPAGLAGNTSDTNSNAADFLVQPAPNPQNLAAPPVPAPGPSALPSPDPSTEASPNPPPTVAPSASALPTIVPTPTPGPTPTELPTPEPSLDPSLAPSPSVAATIEPTPTVDPTPTIEPTVGPTPTFAPSSTPDPTPEITPAPTAAPTASPTPAITILAARALPSGTTAEVEGVLTTGLGALESGRKGFVQDATGGIAIYLDAAVVDALPAGTFIRVTGTLDERFAERTLRVALADVSVLGAQGRPEPVSQQTGAIGEQVEGLRVLVQGVTVGTASDLADGLGLMVDDGSGAVRVIVGPAALGGASVPSGTAVVAHGPVGQRDSSGTGLSGYRIHVTEPGDFGVLPPPTPAPSPTPAPTSTTSPTASPSATAGASTSPAPTRTPAPSPTPSPSPAATLTIGEARDRPIGTVVTVAGVVTAEAGRIGSPPLLAIADSTGGVVVRLPDTATPPARGTLLLVRGAIADPYGQLELRPTSTGFSATGHGSLPVPLRLSAVDLGEATEGRLAELTGTVATAPQKGTSGNFTVTLADASGAAFRLLCDASSGIDAATFGKGRAFRVTGIVGQRASRKGALDGYRLYLRDTADIVAVAGAPGPGASPGLDAVSIATALAYADETPAIVEGNVTAHATLLDSTGRRIVIQDATGAIEVLLPSGSTAPSIGTRLRVTGATGHAYGAPRIGAASVESLGKGSAVSPASLGRPPAERDEWQLVRISGRVEKVERMGDRWRAEIVLANGSRAPVHGQAGAGIPSTAIVVGRPITVIGIVRRPYPTASDRRFGVLPRDGHDLALGRAAGSGGGGTGATGQTGTGAGAAGANGASSAPAGIDITPDTDLAVLADHVGARVRVGGLIATVTDDGFDLDDGTAVAHVGLRGAMVELLPHLRAGEAIAATGVVELQRGAAIVIVDDAGALFRVGNLGEALPIDSAAGPGASPAPGESGALEADATGLGPNLAPASALTLAGLALLSMVATVLRRQLQRRRLRAVLVARLAGLRAADPEPEAGPELAAESIVEVPPAGPARAASALAERRASVE